MTPHYPLERCLELSSTRRRITVGPTALRKCVPAQVRTATYGPAAGTNATLRLRRKVGAARLGRADASHVVDPFVRTPLSVSARTPIARNALVWQDRLPAQQCSGRRDRMATGGAPLDRCQPLASLFISRLCCPFWRSPSVHPPAHSQTCRRWVGPRAWPTQSLSLVWTRCSRSLRRTPSRRSALWCAPDPRGRTRQTNQQATTTVVRRY